MILAIHIARARYPEISLRYISGSFFLSYTTGSDSQSDCGSDTKEAHADEDKQRRELVEAKNNAESMCFQLEKLLKEHDAVLNQTDKDAIHSAIGQSIYFIFATTSFVMSK